MLAGSVARARHLGAPRRGSIRPFSRVLHGRAGTPPGGQIARGGCAISIRLGAPRLSHQREQSSMLRWILPWYARSTTSRRSWVSRPSRSRWSTSLLLRSCARSAWTTSKATQSLALRRSRRAVRVCVQTRQVECAGHTIKQMSSRGRRKAPSRCVIRLSTATNHERVPTKRLSRARAVRLNCDNEMLLDSRA
jgi:hypothetical protein